MVSQLGKLCIMKHERRSIINYLMKFHAPLNVSPVLNVKFYTSASKEQTSVLVKVT